MEQIRRIVRFSGRVQGVGFRYTTCRVAKRFEVTGYVCNLSDGRVELVAEGEAGVLEGFIDGVRASMRDKIDGFEVVEEVSRGEFCDFNVRT